MKREPEYIESKSRCFTGWYYNGGTVNGCLTPDDVRAITTPTLRNGALLCDDDLRGPFKSKQDAMFDSFWED